MRVSQTQTSWSDTQDVRKIERMLKTGSQTTVMPQKSVAEQSIEYANQMQMSRMDAKKTANAVKRLQYDFKSISTQILRSKTSLGARQVAGKARREVLRLKREKQNGGYDDEEIQAAITHAQAMERAARKKARNLQMEELIHVDDSASGSSSQPVEDLSGEDWTLSDEEQSSEETDQNVEPEDLTQELVSDAPDPALMEQMYDAMGELLEESFQQDWMKELTDIPPQNMNQDDFRLYQKKHRAEEQKAITKADGEYLKAVFDQYQKAKEVPSEIDASGNGAAAFDWAAMPAGISIDVSI